VVASRVVGRYALRFADGDDAGEIEYPDGSISPGDEIPIEGNRLVRVTAVLPVELAGEFVDGALYGTLEVEPI
jgi:hypothetical protein